MAISLTLLLLPPSATATELKLATWNLEWLTTSDRDLPPDVHPKRPQDIDLLRRYATELDADVIAVQEVDGAAITASVFPPDKYSIHLSHDHVVQRVGIVVRRGLHYDVNPDLTGLDVDPGRQLRSGVDVTLQLQPPLRVLAVHLKTGCPMRVSATPRAAPAPNCARSCHRCSTGLAHDAPKARHSQSSATSTATWMDATSSGPRYARQLR